MGEFISITAVETTDQDALVSAVTVELEKKGVSVTKNKTLDEDKYNYYTFIQDPKEGWIVITWPPYFGVYESQMSESLSKSLGVGVSTFGVYDGSYWYSTTYKNGQMYDSFSSFPDYWAKNEEESKKARANNGDAETLAKHFGVPEVKIKPYLVHRAEASGKAHPGDIFELSNTWVFTDFMKTMGIEYPESLINSPVVLELPENYTDLLIK